MNKDQKEQILKFIDRIGVLHPDYIVKQLKTNTSLGLIEEIIQKSGKEASEAVLVLLAAVHYLMDDVRAVDKLKEKDSFLEYIKENYDSILKISIERGVQANLPERALPVLEVLEKKIKNSSYHVIELGASFGLIGRVLLNPGKVIENKDCYFTPDQQMPQNHKAADRYLGIELDPPDERWFLACVDPLGFRERLERLINDIKADEKFQLIKGNAFGFPGLEPVKNFCSQAAKSHSRIVVLTSFMLYQLDREKQMRLKDEILKFVHGLNGYWLNMVFYPSSNEFFVEFNQERIIQLPDDLCKTWRWL